MSDVQKLLVGHGALVMWVGFVVGFGFAFFLLGRVELWPIPGSVEVQLPGTYDAWRMAHLEGVLNGAFLWMAAVVLPLVPLGIVGTRRLAWAFIVTRLGQRHRLRVRSVVSRQPRIILWWATDQFSRLSAVRRRDHRHHVRHCGNCLALPEAEHLTRAPGPVRNPDQLPSIAASKLLLTHHSGLVISPPHRFVEISWMSVRLWPHPVVPMCRTDYLLRDWELRWTYAQ